MSFLLLFNLLFSLSSLGDGTEIHVNSPDNLIEISDNVDKGLSYSGTTVILDSDIDFTEKTLNPIGQDWNRNFRGVLDGKGYGLKNLKINVSSGHAGIFGYSLGLTIKDLVVDNSCSFMYSGIYIDHNPHIGSIVGVSQTNYGQCIIDSVVNMASVTFNGWIKGDLHLGGIIGVAHAYTYEISIRNCVNYGTVVHNGTVGGYCDIGGIAGHSTRGTKIIQSCLNYGTITHSGSTSGRKCIGGIIGNPSSFDGICDKTVIENCLSAGEIRLNNKTGSQVGGIVGYVDTNSNSNITHCYWTNNTGYSTACGENGENAFITTTTLVELNMDILNAITEYAEQNGGTKMKWFLLHLNGGEINGIKQDTMVVAQNNFPTPVKEGNTFLKWCEDICCDVAYDPKASNATELYAIWNTNILTLNFNNGTVINRTLQFNENIVYPENISMDGHIFKGWEPQIDKMGGCEIVSVAQWDTVPNISSSSDSMMPTKFVEIVFSKKDLTEEEVKEIIESHFNGEYTIVKFWNDKSDETSVIIEFKDKNAAEKFVRSAKESSTEGISSIEFVHSIFSNSFSLFIYPTLLNMFFL